MCYLLITNHPLIFYLEKKTERNLILREYQIRWQHSRFCIEPLISGIEVFVPQFHFKPMLQAINNIYPFACGFEPQIGSLTGPKSLLL